MYVCIGFTHVSITTRHYEQTISETREAKILNYNNHPPKQAKQTLGQNENNPMLAQKNGYIEIVF